MLEPKIPCPNCGGKEWEGHDNKFGISGVRDDEKGFDNTRSVIVLNFHCVNCGYMMLFKEDVFKSA